MLLEGEDLLAVIDISRTSQGGIPFKLLPVVILLLPRPQSHGRSNRSILL